ncbi:MAG: histone-like protein [Candidatus Micrarchaeota archaeon]
MVEEEELSEEERVEKTGAAVAGGEELEPDIPLEQETKLPFPSARVVRIIKQNFKKAHQIKSDVKIAANELLGEILADIAQRMDEEEFFTVSIEHFNKAARKYKMVDVQEKRMQNIRKLLEKQRGELEEKIMQLEHADEW